MSNYARNKAKARYRQVEPTITDQAASRDTDINIIMKRFDINRRVNTTQQTAIEGDLSMLPDDLHGFFELARQFKSERQQIHPKLRDLTNEQLFALTGDQVLGIITPPAPEPAKEEVKK